jgi:hypothetical protein
MITLKSKSKLNICSNYMFRIRMNLDNPNTQLRQNMSSYTASMAAAPRSRPAPLNAPMIDRVHKAKPGCSACGKKVA